MSSLLQLHAGTAGNYRWGSHLTRFSFLGPVNGHTLPRTLAGSINSQASWNSNVELRESLVIMHETVHYFQNLLTGTGYWDSEVMRRRVPEALGYARAERRIESVIPGEAARRKSRSQSERWMKEGIEELIFLPNRNLPRRRKEQIGDAVEACTGKREDQRNLAGLWIENILEAEAVANVLLQTLGTQATDRQREIWRENNFLSNPDRMQGRYQATIVLVAGIFEHWMGSTFAEMEATYGRTPIYIFFYRLLALLIDIACAHPSPAHLAKRAQPMYEFDPGLKLIRLLASLQRFTKSTAALFQKALGDKDYAGAERILLAGIAFDYAHSAEIYKDWAEYFAGQMSESDDRLIRLRSHCCRMRIDNPGCGASKSLGWLVVCRIPLFYLTPGGLQSYGFAAEHFDPAEEPLFLADLLKMNRDLGLWEYFMGSGKFVCPLAEADSCDGRTAVCESGIERDAQFPEAICCSVRRSLEQAGFILR
ncbi:MAG: hypothetical protein BGO25_13550 [Acidobacteriales bacterium 59-55]|nr:hypothetical protein [Terriglobales bacterium]ODU55606.1 MAG: hypothetical protein ABT04_00525 [Granulicella sp. SCN 62-9]OJV44115.1 MAG: hypothetical protein BGO25_13550 [Acidobacteriales bacterium 59-55]